MNHCPRSSPFTWSIAALLTLGLTACEPAEVSADGELDASSSELMVKQERLEATANALDDQLAADPAFSSLSVDPVSNRLVVYLTGSSTAVESQLQAAGVRYEVRAALLSKVQVDRFDQALEEDADTLASLGVDVSSFGAAEDGSGYQVTVSGDATTATHLLASRYPAMAAALQVSSEGVVPLGGRLDDSSPYFGGSRLLVDDKQYRCTSGFGVKGSNGSTYITSAYHCVDAKDPVVRTGAGNLIGKFSTVDPANDVAFVKVASASSWIFTEGFNAPSAGKKVSNILHPHPGSIVCFDGSFTGRVCTGKVGHAIHWTVEQPFTGKKYTIAGYYADQPQHKALAGEGDSGGPVYAPHGDGTVGAIGLISAGAPLHSAYCPDWNPKHERGCAWRIYFGDFKTIAVKHHLTVGFLK